MKRIALVTIVLFISVTAFADDGAALYKSKCASCHGADGKGQTAIGKTMKLRDLGSPEVQKQTDAELYAWTADGKGKMPGYKSKMSESEIKALVVFMRTFKK
jgi:mono/diheme cytochrome c family protein